MAAAFIILLAVFITKLNSAMDLRNPEGVDSEEVSEKIKNMPELAIIVFSIFATFAGNLAGLVLGIIGIAQKERKKVFPILGTVLNGLVIGFLLFLFVVGLAVASAGHL